jgi:hypothetical protein
MTIEADVQQGWHDAIVELIDLDLSTYYERPCRYILFYKSAKA